MRQLPAAIVDFLGTQDFVVISSIDKNGYPHTSCKDIVKIDPQGEVYLMDVYHGTTSRNIAQNPLVSISVVDEHKFIGYCLKGRARIIQDDMISQDILRTWEDNITSRLTKRLLKNLYRDKGQGHHPEAKLPLPKYLIIMEVDDIVDLAPHQLKKEV